MMKVDGRRFALTYLSVAIATGDDPDRPALYRTVLMDAFPGGVRLVATDSYLLLLGWCERADTIGDTDRVDDSEVSDVSWVLHDPDGRLAGLMKYVAKQTKKQDLGECDPIDLAIRPGVHGAGARQGMLEGFEPTLYTFEVPDQEAVSVVVTPASEYPNWRIPATAAPVDQIVFGPQSILRLGRVSDLHGGANIALDFGGPDGPAWVKLIAAPGSHMDLDVRGLAMPVKLAERLHREWGPEGITDEALAAAIDEAGGLPEGATVTILHPDGDRLVNASIDLTDEEPAKVVRMVPAPPEEDDDA